MAIVAAIGLIVDSFIDNDVSLAVSFVVTSVILFFGFLFLARRGKEGALISGTGMRTAIAGTVVMEYLLLVGDVAFFLPRAENQQAVLNPITQMMISSFTTIVGIVIAFYFGSSALLQMRGQIPDPTGITQKSSLTKKQIPSEAIEEQPADGTP